MRLIADVAHLPPRDEPRGLRGVLGDDVVACDIRSHATHVLVVRGDDVPEGDLVTGSRGRDDIAVVVLRHSREGLHIPESHGPG